MGQSRTIGVVLKLKDSMSGSLVKVSKKTKNMSDDMQKASKQAVHFANTAKKNFEKVGDKAVKVGLAVGALASAFIIKAGFTGLEELDNGARKVKSIAKDSLKLNNIQKDLLKYSNKTGISVDELAETQYSAISSGVKANESMMASVTASKLAKAGFTDSNSALKIMTSSMNVYGLTGQKNMQKISDMLLQTQNLGVTTVAELAESMGSLTPVANSSGLSLEELNAGMASLTKNGLKTDEAVTNFKGILTSVIKPSEEAAKEAKRLGIDFSVSAIKSKGFAKFLEEVKTKTNGNTDSMGKLFGNVRALSGSMVLTGKGFEDFITSLDAMKNSAGATDEAFNIMNNSIGNQLGRLKNIAKNTATSIMNTQSGSIKDMLDKIDNWTQNNQYKIKQFVENVGVSIGNLLKVLADIGKFLIEHKKAIENIIIIFGSFYAAIKIMKVLRGVIFAVQVVMALLNGTLALSPLGWITLAIGAVIAIGVLLWRNWDWIQQKASELWNWLVQAWNGITTTVTNLVSSLVQNISTLWSGLMSSLSNIWNSISTTFSNIWSSIGAVFSNIWSGISSTAKSILNGIIDGINNVIRGINSLASFKVPDWIPGIGGKGITVNIPTIPHFAKGTDYFTGGLAQINEKGGEIVDLPTGARIIPADKSERIVDNMANKGDIYVYVTIQGNVIGNEEYADYIGNRIVKKIRIARKTM